MEFEYIVFYKPFHVLSQFSKEGDKETLADYLKDIPKDEQAKHRIRKLTPLEALRLQGFDENFCLNASKAGVSNHQLYKQAGNAVSVNTVYSIVHYLFSQNLIKI